jgi:hypothetical protein
MGGATIIPRSLVTVCTNILNQRATKVYLYRLIGDATTYSQSRARIFKLLWSPRIDSKEPIPQGG